MIRNQAYHWYLKGVEGRSFNELWEEYEKPIKEQREREFNQMYPKCPKCGVNKCGQYHLGHPDYDGYCDHCTCKCR